MEKIDDAVLERICAIMRKDGWHDKDLIAYLGLTKGTFANWRRNVSNSYLSYIGDIAVFLGVSLEYLVTGNDSSDPISNSLGVLSEDEKEMLKKYRQLEYRDKNYIKDVMQMIPLKR